MSNSDASFSARLYKTEQFCAGLHTLLIIMSWLKLFADAQGFVLNNEFYPREFTISDGNNFLSYEVDVGVEQNPQDILQTGMVRRYVHGLPRRTDKWKPSMPASAFPEVLKGVYKRLAGSEQFRVAVNNNHLAGVFRKLEIPVVDVFVPTDQKLENACELHAFSTAKCSIAKCKRLYKYLKD